MYPMSKKYEEGHSREVITPWMKQHRTDGFWSFLYSAKEHPYDTAKTRHRYEICPSGDITAWDLSRVEEMRIVHTLAKPKDNYLTCSLSVMVYHSGWSRHQLANLFPIYYRDRFNYTVRGMDDDPLMSRSVAAVLAMYIPLYWWVEVK